VLRDMGKTHEDSIGGVLRRPGHIRRERAWVDIFPVCFAMYVYPSLGPIAILRYGQSSRANSPILRPGGRA